MLLYDWKLIYWVSSS